MGETHFKISNKLFHRILASAFPSITDLNSYTLFAFTILLIGSV